MVLPVTSDTLDDKDKLVITGASLSVEPKYNGFGTSVAIEAAGAELWPIISFVSLYPYSSVAE